MRVGWTCKPFKEITNITKSKVLFQLQISISREIESRLERFKELESLLKDLQVLYRACKYYKEVF